MCLNQVEAIRIRAAILAAVIVLKSIQTPTIGHPRTKGNICRIINHNSNDPIIKIIKTNTGIFNLQLLLMCLIKTTATHTICSSHRPMALNTIHTNLFTLIVRISIHKSSIHTSISLLLRVIKEEVQGRDHQYLIVPAPMILNLNINQLPNLILMLTIEWSIPLVPVKLQEDIHELELGQELVAT